MLSPALKFRASVLHRMAFAILPLLSVKGRAASHAALLDRRALWLDREPGVVRRLFAQEAWVGREALGGRDYLELSRVANFCIRRCSHTLLSVSGQREGRLRCGRSDWRLPWLDRQPDVIPSLLAREL
eukprot:evm.model.scf_720.1 EVM.evm.TU.scf_720.1   scf_720:67276-67659(-)